MASHSLVSNLKKEGNSFVKRGAATSSKRQVGPFNALSLNKQVLSLNNNTLFENKEKFHFLVPICIAGTDGIPQLGE